MAKLPDITVTLTGLELDGVTVAYDEITAVGYLRQIRRATGIITDVIRRFDVWKGSERISLKLDGAQVEREEKMAAWQKLVAASHTTIEPRLRREAAATVQAGGTVTIGRVELNQAGWTWRGPVRSKQYPWTAFHLAGYQSCRIKLFTTPKGDKPQNVGELDTDVENAVLLPQLMPSLAVLYLPADAPRPLVQQSGAYDEAETD